MTLLKTTPLTKVRFGEEQLIGISSIAILISIVPVLISVPESIFVLAAGMFISVTTIGVSKIRGLTFRSQVRVGFGGLLLTVLAVVLTTITSVVTSVLFLGISSIMVATQLYIKFNH